jgi:hypothetical protein
MPRANTETGLAPQEVGGEIIKNDKKVEAGAQLEISESPIKRADRLFDQLQADLRRRKQEAKQAGQDPKTVKGFDKNSLLYKDWLAALNENQVNALEEQADKLQAEIDRHEKNGERIPDQVVADFQTTIRKIAKISTAKRERQDLESRIKRGEVAVANLQDKADTLGGENLPIAKEVANLQGAADVARAQLQVIDNIAIGANDNVEGPPPIPEDYIEQIPASELEEVIVDNASKEILHPNAPAEEKFFAYQEEPVEAPTTATGIEIISGYFSNLIARDQKAKVGFREAIFTKKLNDFVGEDVVFAKLLLKDSNFIKAVQNFFDAPIGPFANKVLEKAAQFSFIIQEARVTYDRIREELKKNPNLFVSKGVVKEEPEDVTEFAQEEGMESKAETAVSPSSEPKAVADYFQKLFPEGFTDPKQIEMQVRKLQSDMDVVKKSWQIQQDTLGRTKFYEVFKRSALKAEIADSEIQIRALSETLIDLGEKLTAETVASRLLSDSELARLNKVLGDHLKSLQKELSKNDTRNILDKYGDLAVVAFAFLTVALNVAEAGRTKHLDKMTKPGIESVQAKPSVAKEILRKMPEIVAPAYQPTESVRPLAEPVVAKPEASTPISEQKISQAGQEIRAKKSAKREKRATPLESRVEEKKPVTTAELDGKISAVTEEIADLQNRLDQVPPVLDLASLTPDQLRQMDEDPNGFKQLNKRLEAKKAQLDGLEKDKLVITTAELAQAQPVIQGAGEKLDFSQIKHEFTINDLGKDEEASLRATGVFARDLLSAHDKVKTVQALAGATSDEKNIRQYLQDAKDAQKLYEYILSNQGTDKAPNQYTLDQAQAGLSIAKKQVVALEKSLPTKDAKLVRADAFEALNKIINANKTRVGVRKGARGIDDRAIHGVGGAVEILQEIMELDLNKGAQLKKLEQAVTKINIVLKDASAESSLRADAKNLMSIVKDLRSSLVLPQTPDISLPSAPDNVSGALRQEIDQRAQAAIDSQAGINLPPKED